MTPGTLTTILNTAQLIIQNADRLTALIRRRDPETEHEATEQPASLEGLQSELQRLHKRLDAGDEANVQQLKFIEQLAKQNEALAESLHAATQRTRWAMIIAAVAAGSSILILMWLLLSA